MAEQVNQSFRESIDSDDYEAVLLHLKSFNLHQFNEKVPDFVVIYLFDMMSKLRHEDVASYMALYEDPLIYVMRHVLHRNLFPDHAEEISNYLEEQFTDEYHREFNTQDQQHEPLPEELEQNESLSEDLEQSEFLPEELEQNEPPATGLDTEDSLYDHLTSLLKLDPDYQINEQDFESLLEDYFTLFDTVVKDKKDVLVIDQLINYILAMYDNSEEQKKRLLLDKAELATLDKTKSGIANAIVLLKRCGNSDDNRGLQLLQNLFNELHNISSPEDDIVDEETFEWVKSKTQALYDITLVEFLARPDLNNEKLKCIQTSLADLALRSKDDFSPLTTNVQSLYQKLENTFFEDPENYVNTKFETRLINHNFNEIMRGIRQAQVEGQTLGWLMLDHIEHMLENEYVSGKMKADILFHYSYLLINTAEDDDIDSLHEALKTIEHVKPISDVRGQDIMSFLLARIKGIGTQANMSETKAFIQEVKRQLKHENLFQGDKDPELARRIWYQFDGIMMTLPGPYPKSYFKYFEPMQKIQDYIEHQLNYQKAIVAHLNQLEDDWLQPKYYTMILLSEDLDKINQLWVQINNSKDHHLMVEALFILAKMSKLDNVDLKFQSAIRENLIKKLRLDLGPLIQRITNENLEQAITIFQWVYTDGFEAELPEYLLREIGENVKSKLDENEKFSENGFLISAMKQYMTLPMSIKKRSKTANEILSYLELSNEVCTDDESVVRHLSKLEYVVKLLRDMTQINIGVICSRLGEIINLISIVYPILANPKNEFLAGLRPRYMVVLRYLATNIVVDQKFYIDPECFKDFQKLVKALNEFHKNIVVDYYDLPGRAMNLLDWHYVSDNDFLASDKRTKIDDIDALIALNIKTHENFYLDRDKWLAIILSSDDTIQDKVDLFVQQSESHDMNYLARMYIKAQAVTRDHDKQVEYEFKASTLFKMSSIRGNRYATSTLYNSDFISRARFEEILKVQKEVRNIQANVDFLNGALCAKRTSRIQYIHLGTKIAIHKHLEQANNARESMLIQADRLCHLPENQLSDDLMETVQNLGAFYVRDLKRKKSFSKFLRRITGVFSLGLYPLYLHIQNTYAQALLDTSPLKRFAYRFWRRNYNVIVDLLDDELLSSKQLYKDRQKSLRISTKRHEQSFAQIMSEIEKYLLQQDRKFPESIRTYVLSGGLQHLVYQKQNNKLSSEETELMVELDLYHDELELFLECNEDVKMPVELGEVIMPLLRYGLEKQFNLSQGPQGVKILCQKLFDNNRSILAKLCHWRNKYEKSTIKAFRKVRATTSSLQRTTNTSEQLVQWMCCLKLAYPALNLEERIVRTDDGMPLDVLLIENVQAKRRLGGIANDVVHFCAPGTSFYQDNRVLDYALSKGCQVMVVMDRLRSPDANPTSYNSSKLKLDVVTCVKYFIETRKKEYAAKGLNYTENNWPIINGHGGSELMAVLAHQGLSDEGYKLKLVADPSVLTHDLACQAYQKCNLRKSLYSMVRYLMLSPITEPLFSFFGWDTRISKYVSSIPEDLLLKINARSFDNAEAVFNLDAETHDHRALHRGLELYRDRRLAQIDSYIEKLEDVASIYLEDELAPVEQDTIKNSIHELISSLTYAKSSFDLDLNHADESSMEIYNVDPMRDDCPLNERLLDFVNERPIDFQIRLTNLIGAEAFKNMEKEQLLREFWRASSTIFQQFYNHGQRMVDTNRSEQDLRVHINKLISVLNAQNSALIKAGKTNCELELQQISAYWTDSDPYPVNGPNDDHVAVESDHKRQA